MSYGDCPRCSRPVHAGPCACPEVGCDRDVGHAGRHMPHWMARRTKVGMRRVSDRPTPRETPAAMKAVERDEIMLLRLVSALGPDEVRVLLYLAKRLKAGEADYGALDLATDARDFEREAIEEDADAVIYRACDRIRAKLKGD